jgi:hypothetical protein
LLYPTIFDTIAFRRVMRKHILTDEEKAAKKLSAIVSDVRLDLDSVGIYLARLSPSITYNRLMLIAESAEFEKANVDTRHGVEPLF